VGAYGPREGAANCETSQNEQLRLRFDLERLSRLYSPSS
jgi:hypothetical protein